MAKTTYIATCTYICTEYIYVFRESLSSVFYIIIMSGELDKEFKSLLCNEKNYKRQTSNYPVLTSQ